MIEQIDVTYATRARDVKKYEEKWISSVMLSRMGYNTTKMKKKCEKYPQFKAIRFNISGTMKYWYRKDQLGYFKDCKR